MEFFKFKNFFFILRIRGSGEVFLIKVDGILFLIVLVKNVLWKSLKDSLLGRIYFRDVFVIKRLMFWI